MPVDDDNEDTPDPRSRANRSVADRLEMLEHDTQGLAHNVAVIMRRSTSFSPEQLQQLEALLVRSFGNAGLRVDEPDHVDEARKDFNFTRSLRKTAEGLAGKIGWAVILLILGAAGWLFTLGINAWKGQP